MKTILVYLAVATLFVGTWAGVAAVIAYRHNQTSEAKTDAFGVMVGDKVQSGGDVGDQPPDPNMTTADDYPP